MVESKHSSISLGSVSIGERELISNLKIELDPGDIKLIKAPNGTGKSVLLSVISGWGEEITSLDVKGNLKIGSHLYTLPNDFSQYRNYAKKRIGYLSHKLYEESLGIKFNEEIDFIEKKYNSVPVLIQDSIELLKAKNDKESLVEKMAKGHRQLMALVDVFSDYKNYDLILLDEPTSYLSNSNLESFINQIKFISQTSNCALLIASNDMRLFCHFDNQIIINNNEKKNKEVPKLFIRGAPTLNYRNLSLRIKGNPLGHSGKLPFFFNEEIKSDESVVLYGPNSSGKSTFLNVCAGLMQLKGKLEFYNNKTKIKKRNLYPYFLSVLFQEPHNFEFRETSDEVLIVDEEFKGKEYLQEFYKRFLTYYSIPVNQNPKTLSSGQLRMIWLASMLGWSGRWILDEPDSSLDDASLKLFFYLLDIHLANKGTVIIATHSKELYEKYDFRTIELK